MNSWMGKGCSWCVWVTVVLAAAVAPWCFGAWEMWWFWPFAAVLSAGAAFTGLRLVLGDRAEIHRCVNRVPLPMVCLAVPFLVYAITRGLMAPVFMEAERSVLLHVSGVVLAGMTIVGMGAGQRRLLFGVLFGSLLAMSAYGIINQVCTGGRYVLWMPGYEQYAGRATGPYYCPDHFAGAMELLVCMSAGLLLDRSTRRPAVRWLAVIALMTASVGVLLSKSRGAGMTLVVIGICILIWGFAQWPRGVRWHWRLVTGSAVLLLAMAGLLAFPAYASRFVSYGGLNQIRSGADEPMWDTVRDRLRKTSRGRMFGGAWRAWKSAPWLGIGPGMHPHLWPRFAATPDGDADSGTWPSMTNDDFHSYEVHNDWLQLMEEYGIVGLFLFLLPLTVLALHLCRRLSRASWCRGTRGREPPVMDGFTRILCGLLAMVAMGFHSLGDFNLQMPGTVWMLAALLGMALTAEE